MIALSILLALVPCGLRDDPPARGQAEADFARRLAAARCEPDRADWAALRSAFARVARHASELPPLDTGPVEQELKNGEHFAALQALDRLMEGRWLDPESQFYAADVCSRARDPEGARLHQSFAQGLMHAIVDGRDGRTPAMAFPVLTPGEEALVLQSVLNLPPGTRSREVRDGQQLAVHSIRSPTGNEIRVYFCLIGADSLPPSAAPPRSAESQ